jgi:hypothetical protein
MAEMKRMTAEQVVGYLLEGDGLDFLRESFSWVVQQLMEAEVSELVGAERGERAPQERLTHRNGYWARAWATRAGEIEFAIPKLRRGSYFPSFLEPRRRSEQALVSVVQEAYVAGVSTRKVDQVVESLGLRISKSDVSRICAGLDEQVDAFRNRPLEGRYPYLWLEAKVEKVRDSGRVVRTCLVVAYGVHESGYREVIALDVGEAETEAFWRSFLRSLVERGLTGVQLVVSDAHAGLKKAIAQVLGCPWRRCSRKLRKTCSPSTPSLLPTARRSGAIRATRMGALSGRSARALFCRAETRGAEFLFEGLRRDSALHRLDELQRGLESRRRGGIAFGMPVLAFRALLLQLTPACARLASGGGRRGGDGNGSVDAGHRRADHLIGGTGCEQRLGVGERRRPAAAPVCEARPSALGVVVVRADRVLEKPMQILRVHERGRGDQVVRLERATRKGRYEALDESASGRRVRSHQAVEVVAAVGTSAETMLARQQGDHDLGERGSDVVDGEALPGRCEYVIDQRAEAGVLADRPEVAGPVEHAHQVCIGQVGEQVVAQEHSVSAEVVVALRRGQCRQQLLDGKRPRPKQSKATPLRSSSVSASCGSSASGFSGRQSSLGAPRDSA